MACQNFIEELRMLGGSGGTAIERKWDDYLSFLPIAYILLWCTFSVDPFYAEGLSMQFHETSLSGWPGSSSSGGISASTLKKVSDWIKMSEQKGLAGVCGWMLL